MTLTAKLKLLFVANDVEFFVAQRFNIVQASLKVGLEVAVAAPQNCPTSIAKLRANGVEFYPIKLSRWGLNPFSDLGLLVQLLRLYRKINPDIVHHFTIKPLIFGSFAARIAGVAAVVGTVPGLGHVFSKKGAKISLVRQVVKFLYRLALRHKNQRIIFQNPSDRHYALSNKLVPAASTRLIRGSGVDLNKFKQVRMPSGRRRILLATRLLWDKGVGDFAEAARIVRQVSTQFEFVLAGQVLENHPDGISLFQINKWKAEGLIEFIGFCKSMPELLASVHVACLPTSYGEGLPKFLIEAAASGRPLIACDHPGCREVVVPGVNGQLVPAHNPRALAEAIMLVANDQNTLERMGDESRNLIEHSSLSDRVVVRSMIDLYAEISPLTVLSRDDLQSASNE